MSALSDKLTTIPATLIMLVMVGGATYAMFSGLCSFDTWWEKMLMISASAASGVLLAADTRKANEPENNQG